VEILVEAVKAWCNGTKSVTKALLETLMKLMRASVLSVVIT